MTKAILSGTLVVDNLCRHLFAQSRHPDLPKGVSGYDSKRQTQGDLGAHVPQKVYGYELNVVHRQSSASFFCKERHATGSRK